MWDVLVVEDEALVREMLVSTLEGEGLRALSAGTGREALAQLRTRPELRALIADVYLGAGLDGFALAAEALRANPGLGIVYVTGLPLCLPEKGLGARERLLSKPVRHRDLLRAVRDVMPPAPRARQQAGGRAGG